MTLQFNMSKNERQSNSTFGIDFYNSEVSEVKSGEVEEMAFDEEQSCKNFLQCNLCSEAFADLCTLIRHSLSHKKITLQKVKNLTLELVDALDIINKSDSVDEKFIDNFKIINTGIHEHLEDLESRCHLINCSKKTLIKNIESLQKENRYYKKLFNVPIKKVVDKKVSNNTIFVDQDVERVSLPQSEESKKVKLFKEKTQISDESDQSSFNKIESARQETCAGSSRDDEIPFLKKKCSMFILRHNSLLKNIKALQQENVYYCKKLGINYALDTGVNDFPYIDYALIPTDLDSLKSRIEFLETKENLFNEQQLLLEKDNHEFRKRLLQDNFKDSQIETLENNEKEVSNLKIVKIIKKKPKVSKSAANNKTKCKEERKLKSFECYYCKKVFDCKANIIQHLKSHSIKEPYSCAICKTGFLRKRELSRHLVIHSKIPLSCTHCEKVFLKQERLDKHLESQHSKEKIHACTICNKSFANIKALYSHNTVHKNLKFKTDNNEGNDGGREYRIDDNGTYHVKSIGDSTLEETFYTSDSHQIPEKYKCTVCHKVFKIKRNLDQHVLSCRKQDPLMCDICGALISSKKSLLKHLNAHYGINIKPFECTICNKKFALKSRLLDHKLGHSGQKPYLCNVCGKTFSSNPSFKTHLKIHSGIKPHCCTICNKAFLRKEHVKQHMSTHGKPTLYPCPECNVIMRTVSGYNSHVSIHYCIDGPYKCTLCKKSYDREDFLKRHIRVHNKLKNYHKERRHKCSICPKSFFQRAHLDTHVRYHTGERPFACDICQKSFHQKAQLNLHRKWHTNERNFHCNYCTKSFVHKTALIRHIRTHTGDRPYRCKYCNRSFAESGNLVQHVRLHTGDKPIKCLTCNKSFVRRSHLENHMKIHKDNCMKIHGKEDLDTLEDIPKPENKDFTYEEEGKEEEGDTTLTQEVKFDEYVQFYCV